MKYSKTYPLKGTRCLVRTKGKFNDNGDAVTAIVISDDYKIEKRTGAPYVRMQIVTGPNKGHTGDVTLIVGNVMWFK